MRVVIDLQGAQTESKHRGIGRYSLSFTEALARIASAHEVWIALNQSLGDLESQHRAALAAVLPEERFVQFRTPAKVSWENPSNEWRRSAAELVREHAILSMRPDIVIVTSLFEGARLCDAVTSVGRLSSEVPTAVVVYDFIPLRDPQNYLGADWLKAWYFDKVESLKRADLLFSISEFTRREALDLLELEDDRVVNVSTAHSGFFSPGPVSSGLSEALSQKYGIRQPYLMYNGVLESRKNLDRLLEAFAELPDALKENHQLVFVGRVNDLELRRVKKLCKDLRVDERVVLTGHVEDDELLALFRGCSLFVFPSLQEGFGLPALEAMACGVPTIGSNATSIPEVIGRPDALFDPRDVPHIRDTIVRFLSDTRAYQELKEHAVNQARRFTWESSAKIALKAIAGRFATTEQVERSWSTESKRRQNEYMTLLEKIRSIDSTSVQPTEEDLASIASCIAYNAGCADDVVRRFELPERIRWRVEGPFDSSYSLALLNRETARALDAMGHRVVLHSTEGPGDFDPNQDFLRKQTDLARLYERSKGADADDADVLSRILYPPRVHDMDGRVNLLHHYAWEESGFPCDWAAEFDDYLQGITCLSAHVRKILVDHGVTVPLEVSGAGVDHWERTNADTSYPLDARPFRFLHVSSCFPRKGAELLVDSYLDAFEGNSEVSLVIKTFPNPHNRIKSYVEDALQNQPNSPEIVVIEEDLADEQLKGLYERCHVLVAPSKAEGFGLPLAEAFLSGLPVITTGWGGQLDFCTAENAWFVDFQFEYADTHFELFDSVWAEPLQNSLVEAMKHAYNCTPEERSRRAQNGRDSLLNNFTWRAVAARLVTHARKVASVVDRREPRIGWISTWNTPCGIASYSENLVQNLPVAVDVFAASTPPLSDHEYDRVIRCWNRGLEDDLSRLSDQVGQSGVDTIVLQFNYGFFAVMRLSALLRAQQDRGLKTILVLHSTEDPTHTFPQQRLELMLPELKRCDRILVHAPKDLNRLKQLGLLDNVTLFPHGTKDFSSVPVADPRIDSATFRIASYGFFLPHKGLLQLIEAIGQLNKKGLRVSLDLINAEYPEPQSRETIAQAQRLITKYKLTRHVTLQTAYLDDVQSAALLRAADLIVFPYQETGESSSAAVRFGLSTGKPVAVTPLSIFDDVRDAVFKLPGGSPSEIAEGLESVMRQIQNGSEAYQQVISRADRWRQEHRLDRVAKRLYGMIKALHGCDQFGP